MKHTNLTYNSVITRGSEILAEFFDPKDIEKPKTRFNQFELALLVSKQDEIQDNNLRLEFEKGLNAIRREKKITIA